MPGNSETYNKDSRSRRSARIVLNSLFLFLRFAFLMLLDLFALRYVLRGLGEVDFGIYSAVASVVLIGACLKPVLSLSMQRYFSYALGENDLDRFSDIYSVSLNISFALIIGLLLAFETGGLFFFYELTIPAERIGAAMWVFQSSLVAFLFTIAQIPFMAAIFAHEDMGAYSIISAVECALKFLVAVYIVYAGIDGLVFYGLALMSVSFLTWAAYAGYAKLRYSECSYHWRGIPARLYKELLSFSGWTLYGAIAGMGMIQGGAILLNIFFGPVVNAAFGIVLTVYNAFNSVTNSIVVAVRPAMVKSYAEKQFDFLNRLFAIANRAILYLLLALAIPLALEMPYVLDLWLVEYPEHTVLFARLIIVFSVLLALNNTITTIIQAHGDIKHYFLSVETITIMNVPVTWFVFKLGAPPYAIFVVMISLCAVAHALRLYCLKRQYPHFAMGEYFSTLLLPGTLVVLACTSVALAVNRAMDESLARLLCSFALVGATLVVLVFVFGVTRSERAAIIRCLNRKR